MPFPCPPPALPAYKDFEMLVEVNKGDTVTCYIKHLDIDVKARVIDYERDLITGEYTYIELGNVVSNFFNEQADIQSKVNNILNLLIIKSFCLFIKLLI